MHSPTEIAARLTPTQWLELERSHRCDQGIVAASHEPSNTEVDLAVCAELYDLGLLHSWEQSWDGEDFVTVLGREVIAARKDVP